MLRRCKILKINGKFYSKVNMIYILLSCKKKVYKYQVHTKN